MENQTPNKNVILRIILCLVTILLTTGAGFVGGIAYYRTTEIKYETHAVFKIDFRKISSEISDLDFSSLTDVRHDQVLAQANTVSLCLSKNKLDRLSCFDHLPQDEIAAHIIENLTVTQNANEPTIYEIAFQSSRADDARTIVNNLIATYDAQLQSHEKEIVGDYLSRMREASETIDQLVKNSDSLSKEELSQLNQSKAEILKKQTNLTISGISESGQSDFIDLIILQPAAHGEAVRPKLPIVLATGVAIGFAIGIGLILFWYLIRLVAKV